jgi:hypothetical protein
MLRSMNDLENYAIDAIDGAIGHVRDFYFDDETWVIRYLVVETGTWLSSRKVLISPFAIGQPDWEGNVLPVSITKEQVRNSPDIDTERPISRQHEIGYLGYYGYPYYWGGAGLWGPGASPGMLFPGAPEGGGAVTEYNTRHMLESGSGKNDDPDLRSCKAVMNYHIAAIDGDIGHVHGMLVDEESWAIRYMIVQTSNWWTDHQVLIEPQSIQEVSWLDHTVTVDLTRQAVKDSPPYDE